MILKYKLFENIDIDFENMLNSKDKYNKDKYGYNVHKYSIEAYNKPGKSDILYNGNWLNNIENIIKIIRYEKNLSNEIIFSLEKLEQIFSDSNLENNTRWHFIPVRISYFVKILEYLEKYNLKGYNFYELGSGPGIKCMLVEKFGYNPTGFEMDKQLLDISKKIGLSDLVKKKNIFDLTGEELQSPKIIYYYQPIKNNLKMFEYEVDMINNIMKTGDILIRFVTYWQTPAANFSKKEEDFLIKKVNNSIELIGNEEERVIIKSRASIISYINPSQIIYIKK